MKTIRLISLLPTSMLLLAGSGGSIAAAGSAAAASDSGPFQASEESLRPEANSASGEVRLLGHAGTLAHRVGDAGALVVDFPAEAPSPHAHVLKFTGFEFAPPPALPQT